jgi:hypothetical protein
MNEVVFFLEEPSAQAMLEGLLPKLLPENTTIRYIVFEGKQDLEKQLVRKLRGYGVPNARFVVLRDQDASECHAVKSGLSQKCREAGRPGALVRVACHEIESWYLADLAAVEKGLGVRGLSQRQNKRQYVRPDGYPSPSRTMMKIVPSYQKVSGSRAIGPHLDLGNTRSHSFGIFVAGLRRLLRV